MQTIETCITSQTKKIIIYSANKAARAFKKKMATLRQALNKTMTTFEFTDMLDKGDSFNDQECLMTIH
jgi:hypothetical protein